MTCMCADGRAQKGASPGTSVSGSPRSEESSQTACSRPMGGKVKPHKGRPAKNADLHGFSAMGLFNDSIQDALIPDPPAGNNLQQHLLSPDGSAFQDESEGALINLGTAIHSEVLFLMPFQAAPGMHLHMPL